jgi:hypothetical protein
MHGAEWPPHIQSLERRRRLEDRQDARERQAAQAPLARRVLRTD